MVRIDFRMNILLRRDNNFPFHFSNLCFILSTVRFQKYTVFGAPIVVPKYVNGRFMTSQLSIEAKDIE